MKDSATLFSADMVAACVDPTLPPGVFEFQHPDGCRVRFTIGPDEKPVFLDPPSRPAADPPPRPPTSHPVRDLGDAIVAPAFEPSRLIDYVRKVQAAAPGVFTLSDPIAVLLEAAREFAKAADEYDRTGRSYGPTTARRWYREELDALKAAARALPPAKEDAP